MPGPENYKEFDTSSIISRDTVSFGKITVRKREIFLGAVALIAIVIVIILAIVLAVEAGGKHSGCDTIVSHQGQTSNQTAVSNPTSTCSPTGTTANNGSKDFDYCITSQCLQTAAYEKKIMDETVNPCDNFYRYACGGYAAAYRPTELSPEPSPYDQVLTTNVQNLLYLLDYEPERSDEQSYERKLRHFMQSCNNHFDKMQLRGQPLLNKVITPLGGWYVLGQWDPSTFSLHTMLKKVHFDFWTAAFFNLRISTDFNNWNKKVIELDQGGVELPIGIYSNPAFYQIHSIYTSYMVTLAQYLVRDAGVTRNDAWIGQFADDVFEVESAIDKIRLNTTLQMNPHDEANRMTLGQLTQLTNNTLNFVDYFQYAFPNLASMFTDNTAVAVLKEGYFHQMGPFLKNYTSSDVGKRKLHNYMMWRLISRFAADLSWEYVHARRQLQYYVYRQKTEDSGFVYCFRMAQNTMRDAMGAVFITNHIDNKDKEEASNILEQIKTQLIKELTNLSWMTPDNRQDAINKIRDSLYKIGFPDYMIDNAYMDSLYAAVTINVTDYFGNILSLNQALKRRFGDIISKPDSKTSWSYSVYNPVISYYNPWHELMATAASIQYPLFAYNGPRYYNFGGVGTLLARNLIHAVDEYGSGYKLDKSNVGDWWSNATRQHYDSIRKCAVDAQEKETLGPYVIDDPTDPFSPNMGLLADSYAAELFADVSGLQLSYRAFSSKMATAGREKLPAGFPNSSLEKMFFVAFAQAHCENADDYSMAVKIVFNSDPPGEYKVNMAVSQVQEFRDTFGCKAGDRMAPAKTCTLFQ